MVPSAHVVRRRRRTTIETVAKLDVRPGYGQEIHEHIAAAQHHPALTPIPEEATDA